MSDNINSDGDDITTVSRQNQDSDGDDRTTVCISDRTRTVMVMIEQQSLCLTEPGQ